MSTDCRPSVDQVSTECRPSIDRVSTECRPTIDRLSTEYRPLYRPLYRPISRSTLPTVNKIHISLPFVACRLTPFRPSLSLFYGLPRLISKCEVNESLLFQIIAFSGEGKQVKHCDIAFLDWELQIGCEKFGENLSELQTDVRYTVGLLNLNGELN